MYFTSTRCRFAFRSSVSRQLLTNQGEREKIWAHEHVLHVPLSPESIVALSLDFLQELLLRKQHGVLHVLILPDIKHVGSDDPRLVNIDDIHF
jgi:hypothetical protein